MMMAGAWPPVWLWGSVLTGSGFILLEIFQGIRLKAAYWADSWNWVDAGSSLAIIAFIAIHFAGWSEEAEVSSGIVIALLFALRLLQTASLHPASDHSYCHAVVRMFSDISMFLCLYVYILLVFAVVFTLLSSDEDHQYFGSFAKATLTLYSMTPTHTERERQSSCCWLAGCISFYGGLGDFNDALTNAIESHDTLGTVLLFTYVILSSIILLWSCRSPCAMSPPSSAAGSRHSAASTRRCRIAFSSMKAIYCTVDALLFAVAFTPIAIYRHLEKLQQCIRDEIQRRQYWTLDNTGERIQKTVQIWDAFKILGVILVMPLYLLYHYVNYVKAEESYEDTEEWKARERREARDGYKDSIDEWMEAADHHHSNFPDVMAALKHNQTSQFEMLSVLKKMETEIRKQLKQMDERRTKMESQQKEVWKQVDERLTKIEAKIN
ncbi:unnamed protein product [Vitrella brassicaformis CCMP3155]|uniref:Ion transport domain-containing protein n=1 Tax=Vitrella brassicaformis (strain CCMP3155) TaxID=1169540 RepID=A0A0G4EIL6_VITBC|nr:unnamed protein product [Vitrella brassicaformis CCMP3155]|eukprot:CEL96843.1 unnamed protein product [Vitrella brassicaformis CCMP3155]